MPGWRNTANERPSIWSDEEVARRWWRLFPKRNDGNGQAAAPEEHELQMLIADEQALAERRRRLSSSSWFMRCLCRVDVHGDPVAVARANAHRRAPNNGFLSMSLADYWQILDWMGRQVRGDKRGAIPAIWPRLSSGSGCRPKTGWTR